MSVRLSDLTIGDLVAIAGTWIVDGDLQELVEVV